MVQVSCSSPPFIVVPIRNVYYSQGKEHAHNDLKMYLGGMTTTRRSRERIVVPSVQVGWQSGWESEHSGRLIYNNIVLDFSSALSLSFSPSLLFVPFSKRIKELRRIVNQSGIYTHTHTHACSAFTTWQERKLYAGSTVTMAYFIL